MGNRHIAVSARCIGLRSQAVIVAAVSMALQRVQHLRNQIVNVEKLQLSGRVVDLNGQIMGYVVAKRGHSGVVVWAAPFAENIREPINEAPCPCFLCILKNSFFTGTF